MGLLRIGPFDAERSWRPPELAKLPSVADRHGDRVVAALDEGLSVLCGPDDRFVVPAPLPAAFVDLLAGAGFTAGHLVLPSLVQPDVPAAVPDTPALRAIRAEVSGMTLAPYAVQRSSATICEVLGLTGRPPRYPAVVAVNSKSWSNELVRRHGWPGAGTVAHDVAELRRLVTALGETAAVIKDPYGVAGRGSLVPRSPRVLDSIARSLDAQVARGARVELIVQPRYPRRLDFSAHQFIRPDGSAQTDGVVQTDNRGFEYTGTRPAGAGLMRALERIGYDDIVAAVVTELVAAGYHGPVCIDGMVLQDDTVVPVLEVNARTSMGMMGLALQARAASCGMEAILRHLPVRLGADAGFDALAAELGRRRLAFDGSGPGVLPVTAGTLIPPRGRLCIAVFAEKPGDELRLLHELAEAAAVAGVQLLDVPEPAHR